ncbi:FG-GAP-like repeat-containing protein [candidate division CSSED10-310 bacterium]|uniref:FG-GAP-like repeat-containing protein n=1 Tax=candidate division CSSED10-310 bacterium TaxID=2855610 RepID=A0ABV6Z581_UNCC1
MFKTAICSIVLALTVCLLLFACLDKSTDSDDTVQVICYLNLTRTMIAQQAINVIRLSIVDQNDSPIWGPQNFNLQENEHGATMSDVTPGDNYRVYAQALQATGDRVCDGYSNTFNAVAGQQANAGTIDLTCIEDFYDSGQSLGNQSSYGVDLKDLDGDGDLDAFVTNTGSAPDNYNQVYLNDGQGNFTDNGQQLGNSFSTVVELGDLDGDGDMDAIVGGATTVWFNNGNATFTDSGQILGGGNSQGNALGDVDGDGDLDAMVAEYTPDTSSLWLNDGSGQFTESANAFDWAQCTCLGDLDGDGDLDAFLGPIGPNTIWLNDGTGIFTDSGQALGNEDTMGAAFGDLDGDGDLDVYAINLFTADVVYLNDGSANFTENGQNFDPSDGENVKLGDLDNDGDLDVVLSNGWETSDNMPNRVMLNDGAGNFTDTGLALGEVLTPGLALGDVDGDGDLDVFFANSDSNPNEVYFNRF